MFVYVFVLLCSMFLQVLYLFVYVSLFMFFTGFVSVCVMCFCLWFSHVLYVFFVCVFVQGFDWFSMCYYIRFLLFVFTGVVCVVFMCFCLRFLLVLYVFFVCVFVTGFYMCLYVLLYSFLFMVFLGFVCVFVCVFV